MIRAFTIAAASILALAPFSAYSGGITEVFNNGGADTTQSSSPTRPNGIFVADGFVSATQFQVDWNTQLTSATFYAYQQFASTWNNIVDFAISPDVGGKPGAAPIPGGAGSAAVAELARDDNGGTGYSISGINYELLTVTFDLPGVGVVAGAPYWLELDMGTTTGGANPNATNLLWAYNAANSGAFASQNTDPRNWNDFPTGAGAFQLYGVSAPASIVLMLTGLALARVATRRGSHTAR